jgi:hypothetical protein
MLPYQVQTSSNSSFYDTNFKSRGHLILHELYTHCFCILMVQYIPRDATFVISTTIAYYCPCSTDPMSHLHYVYSQSQQWRINPRSRRARVSITLDGKGGKHRIRWDRSDRQYIPWKNVGSRVEDLAEGAQAHRVHGAGLEVHEDGAQDEAIAGVLEPCSSWRSDSWGRGGGGGGGAADARNRGGGGTVRGRGGRGGGVVRGRTFPVWSMSCSSWRSDSWEEEEEEEEVAAQRTRGTEEVEAQ